MVYDALGQNTGLIDARSNRMTFVYDAVGNKMVDIDQLNRRTSMAYDAVQQLTLRLDAKGIRTTYAYNANGWKQSRVYPDGSRTTWIYDQLGNPTNIVDALGDHLRTYDALEQTRTYANPDGRTLTFTWDAAGQRKTLTDPDGGLTTYTYDLAGRLQKLVDPQAGLTTFQYDPAGREIGKQLANGTLTTTTYDANGWLRKVVNATSTGTTITAYAYNYDAVGNKISQTNEEEEITLWTYDATNQLLTEGIAPDLSWQTLQPSDWGNLTPDQWGGLPVSGTPSEITTFTYDPTGNRTLKETAEEITTSTYDAANQLLTAEDSSGVTTHTYDDNGNQVTIEIPSGEITTQTWTYENQLRSVENPLGEITTYTYTPVNRSSDEYQVERETDTETTNYLWDNNNILQEYDTTTIAQYNYHPEAYGHLVSQRRDVESSFYHYDGNYSTSVLTDSSGVETDTYNYNAWGEKVSSSGSTDNPFQWKGEVGYVFDEATGLFTLRRRQYQPETGRFISEDPIGIKAGDTHFYAYVGNNPVNLIDPNGLQERRRPGGGSAFGPRGRPPQVSNDPLSGADIPGDALDLLPHFRKCADALETCKELRDIWKKAGKNFTITLFDIFLAKNGGDSNEYDAEKLFPGIVDTITSDEKFISAIRALARDKAICGKSNAFSGKTLAEFLPIKDCINYLPCDGYSPLTGLDDHQYAIGTLPLQILGSVTADAERCFVVAAGCAYTAQYTFSASDRFSFHGGPNAPRNTEFSYFNQFAKYNKACEYLQNNCGYPAVKWNISGEGTLSGFKQYTQS